MELTNRQYFIYKMVQLSISSLVVLMTIILVALPQTEFDFRTGIELLLAYAGLNLLANSGVKKNKK